MVEPLNVKDHHRKVVRMVANTFKIAEYIDKYDTSSGGAAAGVQPCDMLGAQSLFHIVYTLFKRQDLSRERGVFIL